MYYVYMMANWNNKVLYTGITNNLERRVYEHKNKLVKGFTAKYNINKLVYFDFTDDAIVAISREKQIKGWSRQKKNELVENDNPEWKDLSLDF
ncbi:MAG: GIY-YIG nuclease family protein [Tissierellaceae bacterium]|nr:GIY-YIG nuclease family protein [Tissierellaceae bacterium]